MQAALLAETMHLFGADIHKAYPPPPAAPVPHLVNWIVGGIRAVNTSRAALPSVPPNHNPVMTPAGAPVARGHDAGPLIPHLPVGAGPALVLMVMATSSSKREFGVGSVKLAAGPVAVAVLGGGKLGLQLDCMDPAPPFTCGFVDASLNTSVVAGFKPTDLAASLAALVADAAVQFVINLAIGAISTAIEGAIFDLLFPLAPEAVALVAIVGGPVIDSLFGVAIGDILGGPMGWAPRKSAYTWTTDPTVNRFHKQFLPTGDDVFNLVEGQKSWFDF